MGRSTGPVSAGAEMRGSFKRCEVSLDPTVQQGCPERGGNDSGEKLETHPCTQKSLGRVPSSPLEQGFLLPPQLEEDPRHERVGLHNQKRGSVGSNSFPAHLMVVLAK